MVGSDVKVRDVMTTAPIRVDADAPLGAAIAIMRNEHISHLPVLDEAGRIVGIIADSDVREVIIGHHVAERLPPAARRRLRGFGRALEDLRVGDVMTRAVVTTHPEATIAGAAAIMFEGRFGSLLVVEGGKLVGILTERDLLGTSRLSGAAARQRRSQGERQWF